MYNYFCTSKLVATQLLPGGLETQLTSNHLNQCWNNFTLIRIAYQLRFLTELYIVMKCSFLR